MMIFISCKKEDQEIISVPQAKLKPKFSVGVNVWGTKCCRINNKIGQKCVKNNAKDCKKEAGCKILGPKAIEMLGGEEYLRSLNDDELSNIDVTNNREFMLLLWEEEPELHYHPDSIPKE